MKNCVICGKEFTPFYSKMQVVDSPRCAIILAGQKREEKAQKEWNIEKKQRKEKLKTLSDWKRDLEKEVNHIARLIDKGHECMMCSIDMAGKRVNACHYHSVGSNDTLRFNLFNIWAGCHSCNGEKGGNIHGYDMMLIGKYGRDQWEYIKFELTRLYPYTGLSIPEIKEKIIEARKIVKGLKIADTTYSDKHRITLRTKLNKRLGIYLL
jgi:hypothetical protein